jgi:hypothetical protein
MAVVDSCALSSLCAGKTTIREIIIMAKIKPIAIRTPKPEKTAAAYQEEFGLEGIGQGRAVGWDNRHGG